MLFLVYAMDDPERGPEIRRRTRVEHLQFVLSNVDRLRYGGALLSDCGEMIGTMQIVDAVDRSALDRLLQKDPYTREGLFKAVTIHALKQTIPEIAPGFLIDELRRAAAAQDHQAVS